MTRPDPPPVPTTSQDPGKQSLRKTIGAAAREARLHQGLTQEEVADRLGVAPEVYGRMERGTASPNILTLRKLCMVLNLSADRVLSTANPEAPRTVPEAALPQTPESRHLQRMLQRARKLKPHSVRLLCQLAALLPKKTPAPSKPTRD